jgi:hypothetical protein
MMIRVRSSAQPSPAHAVKSSVDVSERETVHIGKPSLRILVSGVARLLGFMTSILLRSSAFSAPVWTIGTEYLVLEGK